MTHDPKDEQVEPTLRPGPEPERLKIDRDNWEDAVKDALRKKKSEGGWPKDCEPETKKGDGE